MNKVLQKFTVLEKRTELIELILKKTGITTDKQFVTRQEFNSELDTIKGLEDGTRTAASEAILMNKIQKMIDSKVSYSDFETCILERA